jgi:hypothetical protein
MGFVALLGGGLLAQETTDDETQERLRAKAGEALAFCSRNGYNTEFCILVDMKVHSGKPRLFVWNFDTGAAERRALCAHGCGKGNRVSTGAPPLFGNTEGSLLTSLGKYKIGRRAYSQYGIHVHYKLHGLDATNSNAFRRMIVLHSHTPVPAVAIAPAHLPMGWSFGCPVTDNATMTFLDNRLQATKKPVLLWIYF